MFNVFLHSWDFIIKSEVKLTKLTLNALDEIEFRRLSQIFFWIFAPHTTLFYCAPCVSPQIFLQNRQKERKSRKKNHQSVKMWEYSQITVSFLVLLLQLTFINSKSQLFMLKNNKIVMFRDNFEIDEIFQIISKSTEEKSASFDFPMFE